MEFLSDRLQERISEIRFRIEKAAKRTGRSLDDIKLVGITKTVSPEIIKKAMDYGLKDFGENRVQEFLKKYEVIPEANWHFVGRLQTNKVKYIVNKVCLIHSLDSLHLAQEINKAAAKANVIANVLVQVNISRESTKAGISPDDCERFLTEVSKFPNIRVRGLMTIAPFTSNKEEVKRIFASLYKLFIDIQRKKIHNISMEYLSAGMTNDFEEAIEEGANLVRIGTGIFGKR